MLQRDMTSLTVTHLGSYQVLISMRAISRRDTSMAVFHHAPASGRTAERPSIYITGTTVHAHLAALHDAATAQSLRPAAARARTVCAVAVVRGQHVVIGSAAPGCRAWLTQLRPATSHVRPAHQRCHHACTATVMWGKAVRWITTRSIYNCYQIHGLDLPQRSRLRMWCP